MSISIKHPSGTVTSSTGLSFVVQGGSPTNPKNITLTASSVIMPNVSIPNGTAGAIIFDSTSNTMKYYNGFNWIEWVASSSIIAPIQAQINIINNTLTGKVDTVVYSSTAVPNASISGSTLYINFPLQSGSTSTTSGLFTSLPTGSITHYSLSSGQTYDSIREQMSGVSGGQNGRDGSYGNPYITSTGWCLADGYFWSWAGSSGTVTTQTPNLNQSGYLKGISPGGVTKTDSVIGSSGSIGGTVLAQAHLPYVQLSVSGTTDAQGYHVHPSGVAPSTFAYSAGHDVKNWDGGDNNWYGNAASTDYAGNHIHNFSGVTSPLGTNTPHNHTLDNVDVQHFNAAVLYNIATPALALNQSTGDARYVLKSGDIMTGSLTVSSALMLKSDSTNLVFYFRTGADKYNKRHRHNRRDRQVPRGAQTSLQGSTDTSLTKDTHKFKGRYRQL